MWMGPLQFLPLNSTSRSTTGFLIDLAIRSCGWWTQVVAPWLPFFIGNMDATIAQTASSIHPADSNRGVLLPMPFPQGLRCHSNFCPWKFLRTASQHLQLLTWKNGVGSFGAGSSRTNTRWNVTDPCRTNQINSSKELWQLLFSLPMPWSQGSDSIAS